MPESVNNRIKLVKDRTRKSNLFIKGKSISLASQQCTIVNIHTTKVAKDANYSAWRGTLVKDRQCSTSYRR